MFGRKKSSATQPTVTVPKDGIPFLTAKDLLTPHQSLIKKIRNDVGCTKEYFDAYYMPALNRFAEIMQLRPFGHDGEYAVKGGAIDVAVKRVALSVKLRLGALLPTNCKPEEISHRGESWTYGLFIGALMREFGGQLLGVSLTGFDSRDKPVRQWHGWKDGLSEFNHYRMKKVAGVTRTLSYSTSIMHVRDVVPVSGMEWIYRDQELLDCVLDVVGGTHKIQDNALLTLIGKSSSILRENLSFDIALEMISDKTVDHITNNDTVEKVDHETGEVSIIANEKASLDSPKENVQEPPADAYDQELAESPNNQQAVKTESEQVHSEPNHEEEVTAQNFVARLKLDIQKKRISSDYAKLEGNTIKVTYPTSFRSYTESPSELLSELRLIGAIEKEGQRKGVSTERVIVLKA